MELQALIDGLKAHKNGAASYESVDEAMRVFEAMRDVDKEKAVKGLECCVLSDPDDHRRCGECPYNPHAISNEPCANGLKLNALALIRQQQERIAELEAGQKQEPALLENQHKPYGHFINANSPWISRCPKCGKKVEGKQTRYCKYCGQAVKWE